MLRKSWTLNATVPPDETSMGPYVHWWNTKEKPFLPDDLKGALADGSLRLARASEEPDRLADVSGSLYNGGDAVPIPKTFLTKPEHDAWQDSQIRAKLSKVDRDTVITGILDTGIALAHMATNTGLNDTRIIAAWQQGTDALRTDPEDPESEPIQGWLPSGREVFAGEINAALRKFGDQTGAVDEVAFNRELGVSTPIGFFGNRDLERAAAHGTHTLGLAAALDHDQSTEEERRRQRIIAINLPAQYMHGTGGNFLAYFAVYGVERIIFLADALWRKAFGADAKKQKVMGFPIVINFSYGMVAGPKDGHGTFEAAFRKIIEDRKEAAKDFGLDASPVRILMPAGNDNFEQGQASSILGEERIENGIPLAEPEIDLTWQIQPGDSTSNFIEIWTSATNRANFEYLIQNAEISIAPPGGDRDGHKLGPLVDGNWQDLGDFGRVYCRFFERPLPSEAEKQRWDLQTDDVHRLALLVCISPTAPEHAGAPAAPAGSWKIKVRFDSTDSVDFSFFIQSDQAAVATSLTGLRSYFEHRNYRAFVAEHPLQITSNKASYLFASETGALADTLGFRLHKPPFDQDSWLDFGPIQRRGSINALSTLFIPEIGAIAGFNDGNGFPASYSSSGEGDLGGEDRFGKPTTPRNVNRDANSGRASPTVALPSENASSLFGILSAGARDGSAATFRGTSMSTALATRTAAAAFLDAPKADWSDIATEQWFRRLAKGQEDKKKNQRLDHFGAAATWPPLGYLGWLKLGSGRVTDPRAPRYGDRRGSDAQRP